jgi:hypothetical protein
MATTNFIQDNFVTNAPVTFIPPKGSETIMIARLVPTVKGGCNYEIKALNGKPAVLLMVRGMSSVIPFNEVKPAFIWRTVTKALERMQIKSSVVKEFAGDMNGRKRFIDNVLQLPYIDGQQELFIILTKSIRDIRDGKLETITQKGEIELTGVGHSEGDQKDYNVMLAKVVTRDYIKALQMNNESPEIMELIQKSNTYVEGQDITNQHSDIASVIPNIENFI